MLKQREYFVETLSHDLRVSSIAQIRGLDLLKKNALQNDNNLELISEIDKSCKFTLEMMTMLLQTYRFEAGEQVLDCKLMFMEDLVKNNTRRLSEEARFKDLKLIYKTFGKSSVYIDENEINKLIYLLLSTVISNAKKSSNVEVTVNSNFKECKVDFIYNGLPLTEEEYRRMFACKPSFSTVGNGIKMHLCKKIIDFQKGKIFVKKYNKDRNQFTFILPKSKPFLGLKSILLTSLEPYKL